MLFSYSEMCDVLFIFNIKIFLKIVAMTFNVFICTLNEVINI